MKRIIPLLLSLSLLVCGCGSQTNTVDLTQKPQETPNVSPAEESETPQLFDKDVDIILSAYDFNNVGIEQYVEDYKKDNPDAVVEVYDDDHYKLTIKESKRQSTLEEILSKENINATFQEIFSDEQYASLKSVDYNDDFSEFTFYANKEEYEAGNPFIPFGVSIICKVLSDSIQAYNLVPPEDRDFNVLIVDQDTDEVIYDLSEHQDN